MCMLRTFSHFYGSRDIVAHYSHLSFVVSFRFSFLVLLSLGEKWATPKAFLASVVNLFFSFTANNCREGSTCEIEGRKHRAIIEELLTSVRLLPDLPRSLIIRMSESIWIITSSLSILDGDGKYRPKFHKKIGAEKCSQILWRRLKKYFNYEKR